MLPMTNGGADAGGRRLHTVVRLGTCCGLAGPWISPRPPARDFSSAGVRCVAHHKAQGCRMERHTRALAERPAPLSTAAADSTRTAPLRHEGLLPLSCLRVISLTNSPDRCPSHLQDSSTHGLLQLRHQGRVGGLSIRPGLPEAKRAILTCRGISLEKRDALEAFLGRWEQNDRPASQTPSAGRFRPRTCSSGCTSYVLRSCDGSMPPTGSVADK